MNLTAYAQRMPSGNVYVTRKDGSLIGTFLAGRSDTPTKRHRSVTINCARRPIVWLPDYRPTPEYPR